MFINILLGVGAMLAHKRWLGKLDEMQRQIQLEAMAFALGTLWLTLGGLLILNTAEIIHINHWVISLLPALAGLSMLIGNLIGFLRLR
ncbi:hypothetical protein Q7C_2183 [Methylophaga frappieri]|uniref:Uncharacterized protein n=1 Tax=Methylophaga frappieri (strain ATCC BAA-2434 / DSM 25690 / JAM7) TaxID=754477 RepID=I1YK76_METFJ|nr:hypothetical protein Q7C_2183 [Methylophaga frappieri]